MPWAAPTSTLEIPDQRAAWVRVELLAELCQSLLEVRHHLPCIRLTLKAHHEVVGVTNDRDKTARVSTPPLMNPSVKDVVRKRLASNGLMTP